MNLRQRRQVKMSKKKNVRFDREVPDNVGATAKRLFGQLRNQRGRLTIVGICIH